MIDISSSGMDLRFDEDECRIVGFDGDKDVRRLKDMKEMFLQTEEGLDVLYYMFRGVDLFDSIRFDITVLLPGTVGKEYIKTKGHYHPDSYPEVYEVIKGSALYLLQRSEEPYDLVDDVIIVEAKAGDKVVIPPHYGHVTINSGEDVLIMSNLVSTMFSSIYEPYERKKGAAYYITIDGVVKNRNYEKLPYVRRAKPRETKSMGVMKDLPLHTSISEDRSRFEYLNNGDEFKFSNVFEFE
jgi:glucose-6-phosphate isomerase